jgi:hypothetical protein
MRLTGDFLTSVGRTGRKVVTYLKHLKLDCDWYSDVERKWTHTIEKRCSSGHVIEISSSEVPQVEYEQVSPDQSKT